MGRFTKKSVKMKIFKNALRKRKTANLHYVLKIKIKELQKHLLAVQENSILQSDTWLLDDHLQIYFHLISSKTILSNG